MGTYIKTQSLSQDRSLKLLYTVMACHIIWSVLRRMIPLEHMLSIGAAILFFPVIELLILIWIHIKTDRRLIAPYCFIPLFFFAYMICRHTANGDILNHGSSDLFALLFTLCCLISLNRYELADCFYFISKTMLVLSLATSVLSYLSIALPALSRSGDFGPRFAGIETHPNTLASVVTYCNSMASAVCLLKPERKRNWILVAISNILTIKILADTQSRASMMYFSICLLLYGITFVIYWRKTLPVKQSRLIFSLIIIILAIILTFSILFLSSSEFQTLVLDFLRVPTDDTPTLKEAVESILQTYQEASGRDKLRAITLENWKQNIFFGVTTKQAIEGYADPGISDTVGSHNSFIQILATLGIVGLIFFATVCVSALFFLIRTIITEKATMNRTIGIICLINLVAIFINSMYENPLYTSVHPMILIFYYLIATSYQLAKNYDSPHNRVTNA